jgi:hypothetical protein
MFHYDSKIRGDYANNCPQINCDPQAITKHVLIGTCFE